jgi:hypothetical protein
VPPNPPPPPQSPCIGPRIRGRYWSAKIDDFSLQLPDRDRTQNEEIPRINPISLTNSSSYPSFLVKPRTGKTTDPYYIYISYIYLPVFCLNASNQSVYPGASSLDFPLFVVLAYSVIFLTPVLSFSPLCVLAPPPPSSPPAMDKITNRLQS